MKGTIPQEFIREIISNTDIVKIISRYINLKKAGRNYVACCPFHNEKTPSFSVSQEKQIYHCFGCSASGDVINFLSQHDNLSFVEAVEELASINGLRVPYKVSSSNFSEKKSDFSFYDILYNAMNFFRWNLKYSKESAIAINYLKSRGINGKIAALYNIGYASNDWEGLCKTFKKKYSNSSLEKVGLISSNSAGKTYDRFRSRIIFPIRNRQGKVVGFGGRVISNNNQPKYLNSPETVLFKKGEELYGLYELKVHNKSPKEIMVVEGYLDVITLNQFGYYFSVATLGTAISDKQIKILLRETNEIIFCFDGDNAGRNAALKTFQIVLPIISEYKSIKFLMLPNNEDPDSYIKKVGILEFQNNIKKALSFSDFIIRLVTSGKNLENAEHIATILEKLKLIFRSIPENIYTFSIMKKISNLIDISTDNLCKIISFSSQGQNNKFLLRKAPSLTPSIENMALSIAINYPNAIYSFLEKNEITFDCTRQEHFILLDALEIIRQNNHLSSAILIQMLTEKYDNCRKYLNKVILLSVNFDESILISEFDAMLKKISKQSEQSELDKLIVKAKNSILSSVEKEKLKEMLHKMKET